MRRSDTPIEPVRKERRLSTTPDDAFRLFTTGMGSWWPLATHSIAGHDAVDVRFEGWVGGRVVEIARDGSEHPWADILAWDPPYRVVLAWHPTPEPKAASTVEARFEAADGDTQLRLEHRDWEEFGAQEGVEIRADYEPGWDVVLAPLEARAGS